MTHTIPYYGFEFEEFLNDSNSILHHEEPPAAAAEVDEFHVFINPVTIHQTPAPSIVDANPYVPQSSAPIPRNFCCPFYTSNPSEHPKCKDKKFSYMCRVREHISTHTRPFKCKKCRRPFSSKFGVNRHKDTCSHLHHGDDMKKRSRGPRAGPGCSDAGEALHEKLMKMACVDDMVRILADKGTMESAE